jgi:hypothetical protein
VQIINDCGPLNYDVEKLAWVKDFASNMHMYYPNFELNILEVHDKNNVLVLDADLYIYPISRSKIQVGFKDMSRFSDGNKPFKQRLHKISISNKAKTKADALSAFLMLVIGVVIIPSGMGCYSTDIYDLLSVMQQGKNATLVDKDYFKLNQQTDILSLLIWFNGKGKFSDNFYQLCKKIKENFNNTDVLTIANVTDYLILKESTLALVVTR